MFFFTIRAGEYRPLIFAEHAEFKRIFDSLSAVYTDKKMDTKDYDRITKGLKFDGVLAKTDELRKTGVKIELGE